MLRKVFFSTKIMQHFCKPTRSPLLTPFSYHRHDLRTLPRLEYINAWKDREITTKKETARRIRRENNWKGRKTSSAFAASSCLCPFFYDVESLFSRAQDYFAKLRYQMCACARECEV